MNNADRDRYKSLYLATDARMRAAEELFNAIPENIYVFPNECVEKYKKWQSSILAHEKAVKEINHE
jgi:hypothetical protein